jgi:predicted nucleic acid-binding protein
MSRNVLDTDTLTLLQQKNAKVLARVQQNLPHLATTVITIEEELTGWYRRIRKAQAPKQLARAYRRLAESVTSLSGLTILSYTEASIDRYADLLA